jgi:hypothetical protein
LFSFHDKIRIYFTFEIPWNKCLALSDYETIQFQWFSPGTMASSKY